MNSSSFCDFDRTRGFCSSVKTGLQASILVGCLLVFSTGDALARGGGGGGGGASMSSGSAGAGGAAVGGGAGGGGGVGGFGGGSGFAGAGIGAGVPVNRTGYTPPNASCAGFDGRGRDNRLGFAPYGFGWGGGYGYGGGGYGYGYQDYDAGGYSNSAAMYGPPPGADLDAYNREQDRRRSGLSAGATIHNYRPR